MGIRINNNFDLLSEQDDGYIVDDILVRGGHSVVNVPSERDAIPLSARKVGMTVHVTSHHKDYQLVGGITNSSWQEKTLNDVDLPAYAKVAGTTFTGQLSSVWGDYTLSEPTTKITEGYNNNTEIDFIEMSITANDLQRVGELSLITGENSGASAIVIQAKATGLIIPSKMALVPNPAYRNGEFIQGERLIVKAGPSLARQPQDVMTRLAVESLSVTRTGGNCYGHISNWPTLYHTTESKVERFNDHASLGLTEVIMSFTENDKSNVHDKMRIQTPRGTEVTVIRLNSDQTGIIVAISDKSKIKIGDNFKIIDSVIMPLKSEHLASKQYVDDMTTPNEMIIGANYFVNNGKVTDPLDGQTRNMYSFTIPSSTYHNSWPELSIYKVVQTNSYTDYIKISSSVYRHVIRSTASGDDIIIQVWDDEPSTIKVVIQ